MTTPDYLQQVVISGRRQTAPSSGATGALSPSVTGMIWAGLDFLTALVGGLIAYRIRLIGDLSVTSPEPGVVVHLVAMSVMEAVIYLLLFGVYLVFFSRVYGLYSVGQNQSGLHEQRMTAQATLTAGLLLCGTLYVMHGYALSRVIVTLTVLLTMLMQMVRRAVWRKLQQRRYLQGLETRNVLIVGDGRVAHALRNHLEALRHMGFRFKGFISLEPRREEELTNPDVIGDVRNCVALARALFVDEIYFSTPADKRIVVGVVEEARALGIDVRVVPDLYDGLAWNARVEYIGQFPTIPLHRREFSRGAFLIKRVLDVGLSLVVMLLLSPLMILIAALVKFGSKGPVFYRAQRIGRKGRTFTCYKFRTMVVDADRLREDLAHLNEREGVLFKISNDPRITKIGALLRKYSLDELPQLFNVLIGDMSLVGPRPPMAAEVEQYDLAHLRRLDVLPGMTGLWQVEARQDPSFDSYISLDTAYVENWNLLLDLRILARTIGVVVGGTGS
jgi:exopolysaccharide biosynthesis polyprenyl glycosylphosphotransferase